MKRSTLDVVAALGFVYGVQRLMDVADKMHRKLERFDLIAARRATHVVTQGIELRDDAEAAFRILGTITGRIVFGHPQRDIDKVPIEGFRARIANVVGPARDRRQRVPTPEQLLGGARSLR